MMLNAYSNKTEYTWKQDIELNAGIATEYTFKNTWNEDDYICKMLN